MALTRMPSGAKSLDAERVMLMTAPFDALYAGMLAAPSTPAMEAELTMAPVAPASRSCRAASRSTLKMPNTLTFITNGKSSTG